MLTECNQQAFSFAPHFSRRVLAGFLILAANAKAGPITTISFDNLQTGEDVFNYYNGGLGVWEAGRGQSWGFIFSPGWIVSPPDVYDEPGGKSAYIYGAATVDLPAGWSGLFSFSTTSGDRSRWTFTGIRAAGADRFRP